MMCDTKGQIDPFKINSSEVKEVKVEKETLSNYLLVSDDIRVLQIPELFLHPSYVFNFLCSKTATQSLNRLTARFLKAKRSLSSTWRSDCGNLRLSRYVLRCDVAGCFWLVWLSLTSSFSWVAINIKYNIVLEKKQADSCLIDGQKGNKILKYLSLQSEFSGLYLVVNGTLDIRKQEDVFEVNSNDMTRSVSQKVLV